MEEEVIGNHFISDKDPNFILLFISPKEREHLIIEAEWPGGIEGGSELHSWKMRTGHPLFEKMAARYSNSSAQKISRNLIYQEDREVAVWLGTAFVEPEDRIFLYITDKCDAETHSCLSDRILRQWYIPKNHPSAKELIKKYRSNNAKSAWLTSQKKKVEKAKHINSKAFRYISEKEQTKSRLVSKRGKKKGQTPDSRITLRMFAARVKKCWITTGMPKQAVAQLISKELFQIGTNISPSMVLKHIEMGGEDYETLFKRYAPPD